MDIIFINKGIGADAAYRVIHDELSLGMLNARA